MSVDMTEMNNDYSLFGKQICPSCKEKCISSFAKRKLLNILSDHTCPNCKQELRLSGKIYTIGKVIWFLVMTYALIIYFMLNIPNFYFSDTYMDIFVVIVISYILFRELIVIPYSKIEKYDSTPMDDLINNYKKFKSFIKERVGKMGKKDK